MRQHLKPRLTMPASHSQSHSYRQPRHTRARNTHSHRILNHIATQTTRHMRHHRTITPDMARSLLCRTRHTQRHSHRLCATRGRNNLTLHKSNNLSSQLLIDHNKKKLICTPPLRDTCRLISEKRKKGTRRTTRNNIKPLFRLVSSNPHSPQIYKNLTTPTNHHQPTNITKNTAPCQP